MRWDQADLTDDDCAGSKVAPRQTLPASKPPPPKVRWRMRWGSRCDGQSPTKTQARRRLGGRMHPPGRVRSARAQPDEEARENVIDALRELLAARFGSPPELADRTNSDSLELTIAA
jgi:hypothetical protein